MSEVIKYVDRIGTNCNKWDGLENKFGDPDLMALWVADMDFKVPQCVIDACTEYAQFGIYGYYKIPDGYYQNFIDWQKKYHDVEIKREWIRFSPGVVSPVNWYVKMKTEPGDAVLVQKPVYYPFLDAINNHGRKLVSSDLIMPGHEHTEILNIKGYEDMLVAITAGSKTFNLAGCQNSYVILPDEKLRAEYDAFMADLRMGGGNAFGNVAVEAAFGGGREWLDEVLKIIHTNAKIIEDTFAEKLPKAVVTPLEGTYLQWVDFGAYVKPEEMKAFIQDGCKLAIDFGDWFGGEKWATFARFNLATSTENIQEAANRIVAYLTK